VVAQPGKTRMFQETAQDWNLNKEILFPLGYPGSNGKRSLPIQAKLRFVGNPGHGVFLLLRIPNKISHPVIILQNS